MYFSIQYMKIDFQSIPLGKLMNMECREFSLLFTTFNFLLPCNWLWFCFCIFFSCLNLNVGTFLCIFLYYCICETLHTWFFILNFCYHNVGPVLDYAETRINIATRIAAQASPLLYARPIPTISFRGASYSFHKLGFETQLKQSRRPNRKFSGNMSCSVENSEVSIERKLGVVRPETDSFVAEAVEALRAGKVIAVPTDTLHSMNLLVMLVNRIYEIKGRKHTSPLAICVGDVSDIERFAVTHYLPHGLLDSLLPGPVTIVLKRGEASVIEQSLNPGLDSIGVRVPDYNFTRNSARGSGTALALTCANLSGQSSNVCINDFKDLWGHCAYVYDGGLLPLGRAGSTIVDLTMPRKKILRPGRALEETKAILKKAFSG